jgi:hypothetical protein
MTIPTSQSQDSEEMNILISLLKENTDKKKRAVDLINIYIDKSLGFSLRACAQHSFRQTFCAL